MTKFYYSFVCAIRYFKMWVHCKQCGFPTSDENVRCEFVNAREAFLLLDCGISPRAVYFCGNPAYDDFRFQRTPRLLALLDEQRGKIDKARRFVSYDNAVLVCEIPGSRVSPIDNELQDIFAPRDYAREALAYESWPIERRKAYIAADADTRRLMVDAAYREG